MKTFKKYILFVILIFVQNAYANVIVSPMALTVQPGEQGTAQFKVLSKSDQVQYLQLTVKRVESPGTPDERDVDVLVGDSTGLIVSPQRLILPAGASRAVRLVQFTPPAAEMVYRVYVRPVDAPSKEGDIAGEDEEVSSSVRLTLVYGVVVYVNPLKPMPKLGVDESRTKVLNVGNTHVRVERIGRCRSDAADDCRWKEIKRNIFPGRGLDLPAYGGTNGDIRVDFKSEDDGTRSQIWEGGNPPE